MLLDQDIKKIFYWSGWEMILHVSTAIFILYVVYLMFKNSKEVTITNLLLLGIIMSVMTHVHTYINHSQQK